MKKKFLPFLLIAFVSFSLSFLSNVKGGAATNHNNSMQGSTTEYNWYVKHLGKEKTPEAPPEASTIVNKYNDFYLGNTKEKTLYLTFDEGYENGFTPQILDILAKHKVKAAFFVVKHYIKTNPELIKRMAAEGHTVCNHSSTHPSMASIIDKEKFEKELTDVEKAYTEVTGEPMKKYFRPPMGKFSELSLKYTMEFGYKTVFWSLAYKDWDVHHQPTSAHAIEKLYNRTHNGAIILLHTVSETNAKTLDYLISSWIKEGYQFKPITDL